MPKTGDLEDSCSGKTYTKPGSFCWVTFDLTPQIDAKVVSLCGEFNDVESHFHLMKAPESSVQRSPSKQGNFTGLGICSMAGVGENDWQRMVMSRIASARKILWLRYRPCRVGIFPSTL